MTELPILGNKDVSKNTDTSTTNTKEGIKTLGDIKKDNSIIIDKNTEISKKLSDIIVGIKFFSKNFLKPLQVLENKNVSKNSVTNTKEGIKTLGDIKKDNSIIIGKNTEISKKLSDIAFFSKNFLKPLQELSKTSKETLNTTKKQNEINKVKNNANIGAEIIDTPKIGKKTEETDTKSEKPSLFGKFKLSDISGMFSGLIGKVFSIFSKALKFAKIGGLIITGVIGIGKAIFDTITYAFNHKDWKWSDLFDEFFASLINFFSFGLVSKATVKKIIHKVSTLFYSNIIQPIEDFFSNIKDFFETNYQNAKKFISDWLSRQVKKISSFLDILLRPIEGIENFIKNINFKDSLQEIGTKLKNFLSPVINIFSTIKDKMKKILGSVLKFIFTPYISMFKFISAKFKNVFSFLRKSFDNTIGRIENVFNTISDFFKKIEDKISSLEPDWAKNLFGSKDEKNPKKSEAKIKADKALVNNIIQKNFTQNNVLSKITGSTDEVSKEKLQSIAKGLNTSSIKALIDSKRLDSDNQKQLEEIYDKRLKEQKANINRASKYSVDLKSSNNVNYKDGIKNNFTNLEKPKSKKEKTWSDVKIIKENTFEEDFDTLKSKQDKKISQEKLMPKPKEKEKPIQANVNSVDNSKKEATNISLQNNSFDRNIHVKHGLKRIG